jgi:glutamyl-tRNA synthetase
MVRTRFAPSPTGFLHVGSLRTALFSYALAKRDNGMFVLRIEDTDKKREVKGSIQGIVDILGVFGLKFDEGPGVGGPYAPYIQSKKLNSYREKAEELVKKGKAYYCFCSEERLEKLRKDKQKAKKQPRYDEKCRELDINESKKRVENGEKYVIRLKVPKGQRLEIEDKLLGKIQWSSDDVDDQVLLKSDGFPTYHLAVVVDDVLMKISHITRGMEWLSSVPKHILIYKAFGYKFPVVVHMPLILDPKGGKLSKRRGNVSTEQFLAEGYLPEAILNFLMLLGWAPKDNREIFSLKEFVREFSLDRLNKAAPVFNREKLLWFNGEYIRKLSKKDLVKKTIEWGEKYCKDKEMLKNIINDKNVVQKAELIQERVTLLNEVVDSLRFFYKKLEVPDPKNIKGVKRYSSADYKKAMVEYVSIIGKYNDSSSKWDSEKWVEDIRKLAEKYKWKGGDMFMLIRLIICGSHISPPLFESLVILGKKEVIDRLESFIKNCK